MPQGEYLLTLVNKVRQELTRMENLGLVKKVTEPSEWLSSMVVVEKKNTGAICICIDPLDLNKVIMREHYKLPTIEDIVHKLVGATVFSVLDNHLGYWQLRLDEVSSYLTTFNTPLGRWCFTRVPFGIASAQEIFQKKSHKLIAGLQGVEVIVDDLLVYGRDQMEHDKNLTALLNLCREKQGRREGVASRG